MILAWAANILFLFATTNPDLIMSTKEGIRLVDFFTFYEAAKVSASGANLYDYQAQLDWTNKIIAPLHVDRAWPMVYPPTICLMLTPLAMLSLDGAFTLWKYLSVPIGLAGVYVLLRSQTRLNKVDQAAILIAVIANTPALFSIRTGAFSFFLLAFLALYVWGLLKERSFVSGLCLALIAAIKPNYAIFLVLPALTQRRWRVLGFTALSFLAIVAGTVSHYGFGVFGEYIAYVKDVFGSDNKYAHIVYPEFQVNLRALVLYQILHWTTNQVVFIFTAVTFVCGLALSFWVWLKAARDERLFGWSMGFTVTMLLLCGPHVHHYDCLLLAVAAILTLPSVSFSKIMMEEDWSYRIWCCAFLFYPLVSFITSSLAAFNFDYKLPCILVTNIVLAVSSFVYFNRLSKAQKAQLSETASE